MSGTTYLLERALIGDRVERDVLVSVEGGRFVPPDSPPRRGNQHSPAEISAGECRNHRLGGETGSTPGSTPGDEPTRIPGLSIPGIANCHSHAFHRALRGRTQRGEGTFWTWREQMYAVAERLDPDSYYELARLTYREMLCAGITSVGEFHYLHHQPDGRPYDDPNAMGRALIAAAQDAGIRIALLDACYLTAGIGRPPEGVQKRYTDGTADAWASRVAALEETDDADHAVVGAAIHSVRAVPKDQIGTVVDAATGRPLHVHLSEQVAENQECLAAHGLTPTELLDEQGALGEQTSAIHATHLSDHDLALLGGSRTRACFCPTTERDLGDGIGPSVLLHVHGAPLTLGSDSHAVIDPFEEMRAVELNARLAHQSRGHWSAGALLHAATAQGQASIGFPDAGRIAIGQRADLVTIDPASTRTAGTGAGPETVVFAAAAEDVTHVMVDGVLHDTRAARDGLGRQLDHAIEGILQS